MILETPTADFIVLSDGAFKTSESGPSVPVHPLLILFPGGPILVDPGLGPELPSSLPSNFSIVRETTLLEGLESHGFTPDRITAIALTHLHFDHIGWLMDKGRLTFRHASILVQSAEIDWAQSSTVSTEYIYPRAFLSDFFALQPGVLPVAGDADLSSAIRFRLSGGHTPGHQILEVRTSPSTFLIGDTAVSRFFLDPGKRINIHQDSEQVEATKVFLNSRASAGSPLFIYHEANPFIFPAHQSVPEEVSV